LVWSIDIRIFWVVALFTSETEESSRLKSIVVHDGEIGEEASGSLHHTDLKIGEGDELGGYKMVSARVPWVALHNIKLWVLVSEGDGRDHISAKINAKNQDSGERLRDLEHHEEEEGRDFRDVGGQSVGDRLLEIIEDKTTLFDTVDDGREVIIEKKHISGVLSNIRAGSHSDTDISLLDSGGIVDTITSDGDDMTKTLASIDDKELLGWGSSGKDDFRLADPVHDLTALLDLIVVKGFLGVVDTRESITVNDNRHALIKSLLLSVAGAILVDTVSHEVVELKLGVLNDVDLSSDGSSSGGLITSDHDNLNTGGLAASNRYIDLGSGGIIKRDKTDEGEAIHGEPSFDVIVRVTDLIPGCPFGDIKLIS
jgi:hypothetical protein